MKNSNILFTDKIIQNTLLVSLFLFIITLLIGIFSYHLLPPLIPLFNQMPWGENRIGSTIELFIPFGIVLAIILINSFLAAYLYEKMPLVSRMLIISTTFAAMLLFLFLLRTLLVVLY